MSPRVLLATVFAMLAFAGNSLLARAAIGPGHTDVLSFTLLRFGSAALTLAVVVLLVMRRRPGGSLFGAVALTVYAFAFSWAYLRLDAGLGALLLFGLTQVSMIGWGLVRGERPTLRAWAGLLIAAGGLVWLVAPGISAPDPAAAAAMTLAGLAWGVYSLHGRGVPDPYVATAGQFLMAVPLCALAAGAWYLLEPVNLVLDTQGWILGLVSGAFTTGLGYVIWYSALRDMQRSHAAVVQLSVPVIAAAGGVLLLGEVLTLRLVLATVLVLGGIALSLNRAGGR